MDWWTEGGGKGASLVRDEDLETVDDLSERDGSVLLPLLYRLRILGEDDEILFLALVMHLATDGVSTGHVGYVWGFGYWYRMSVLDFFGFGVMLC